MGLDLVCGELNMKCCSYSSVQKIRHELLVAVKCYIEYFFPEKDNLIDYLCSLLKEKNKIQYHKEDKTKNRELELFCLDGFLPFIFHSDCDGTLSSFEAKKFLETWDIVEEYVDSNILKEKDRTFYLKDIFTESIKSGNDILFC